MHQEQSLEQFKEIIPFLKKLGATEGQTDIRFFEGRDGIREIFNDIFLSFRIADRTEPENATLLSFSSGTNAVKAFPDMQKRFIDKRVDLGVTYKAICPASSKNVPEYADNPAELREVRFIEDPVFDFSIQMEIYLDKVMMFSPVKPFGGLIIQNTNIAQSMRALHIILWKTLKAKNS